MLRILLELCPRQEERREHNKGHFIWREELGVRTLTHLLLIGHLPRAQAGHQVNKCAHDVNQLFQGMLKPLRGSFIKKLS